MRSRLERAWHSAKHLEGAPYPAQQPWCSRAPTRSDLVTPAPCRSAYGTAPICQPWDMPLPLETGDRTFPPTLKKFHRSLAERVPTVAGAERKQRIQDSNPELA